MWNWAWAWCSKLSCSDCAMLMKIPSSELNCRMLPCKWVMKWPKLRMQQIRTTDCKEADRQSPAMSPHGSHSLSQFWPCSQLMLLEKAETAIKKDPKETFLMEMCFWRQRLQETAAGKPIVGQKALKCLQSGLPQLKKTSENINRLSPINLCSSPQCWEKELNKTTIYIRFWGRHYSWLGCWAKAAKGELTWDVRLLHFAPAVPATWDDIQDLSRLDCDLTNIGPTSHIRAVPSNWGRRCLCIPHSKWSGLA